MYIYLWLQVEVEGVVLIQIIRQLEVVEVELLY